MANPLLGDVQEELLLLKLLLKQNYDLNLT